MISQKFLPEGAFNVKTLEDISGCEQVSSVHILTNTYLTQLVPLLSQKEFAINQEELRSMQIAGAVIDALSKDWFDSSDSDVQHKLKAWHHAFNVFYQEPGSPEWKLQFANAAYLENLELPLQNAIWLTSDEIEERLYRSETIRSFREKANNKDGYRAESIQMDKKARENHEKLIEAKLSSALRERENMGIELNENDIATLRQEILQENEFNNEQTPTFFWYRKEFSHPDGGRLMVRIGMNGTGLSEKQRKELEDMYRFADILRERDMKNIYYSNTSCEPIIARINMELDTILKDTSNKRGQLILPLNWIWLILEIANDVIKNSPFPLTVVDDRGVVEVISPAYAAVVWHTVESIMNPHFFREIYQGMEWAAVGDNMDVYKETGSYVSGDSFSVKRWKAFADLERENSFDFSRSFELIPSPYPFSGGTVRLNATHLLEISSANHSEIMPTLRFVTDEEAENPDIWTDTDLNLWLQNNNG